MSIYYGEHSIRFFASEALVEKYPFDFAAHHRKLVRARDTETDDAEKAKLSDEITDMLRAFDTCPDTWERWHLIPKTKPVFQPPDTDDSFITIPGPSIWLGILLRIQHINSGPDLSRS